MVEPLSLASFGPNFPVNQGSANRYSHRRPTNVSLLSVPGMNDDADRSRFEAMDINPMETSRHTSFESRSSIATSRRTSNWNDLPLAVSLGSVYLPTDGAMDINPLETSRHPSFVSLPCQGSSWPTSSWDLPLAGSVTGGWTMTTLDDHPLTGSVGSYELPEGGRLTFGSVFNDRPAESNLMSDEYPSWNYLKVRFRNTLVSSEFVFPREGHAFRPLKSFHSLVPLSQYSFVPQGVEPPLPIRRWSSTGVSQASRNSWTPSEVFRRSGSVHNRQTRTSIGSGLHAANQGSTQAQYAKPSSSAAFPAVAPSRRSGSLWASGVSGQSFRKLFKRPRRRRTRNK